ncbi:Fibrous sheath-interacting protein 1 [Mactra antiquata]
MEKNKRKPKDAFATPTSSNRSTPTSAASNALTKSADNRSRAPSSRSVSSKSMTKSENDIESSLSKPELITGYDLRAHLQQIMKFSDDDLDDDDDDTLYSSQDEYSIESFDDKDDRDDELRRLAAESNDDGQARTPLPTGMNHCQSLVPITEEEGEELDSEEENEMMKEIRNEIVNNVRQEMKSELELYQAKMKQLERNADGTPVEPSSDQGTSNLHPDLENLDPKLRAAIIKMKKLDKLLSKRVRREKEVKRDRILLERRIKREIEELHREKKDEYKEVLNNEQKFLALELPSRHNEDSSSSPSIPSPHNTYDFFALTSVKDLYARRCSLIHNNDDNNHGIKSPSKVDDNFRPHNSPKGDLSSSSQLFVPDYVSEVMESVDESNERSSPLSPDLISKSESYISCDMSIPMGSYSTSSDEITLRSRDKVTLVSSSHVSYQSMPNKWVPSLSQVKETIGSESQAQLALCENSNSPTPQNQSIISKSLENYCNPTKSKSVECHQHKSPTDHFPYQSPQYQITKSHHESEESTGNPVNLKSQNDDCLYSSSPITNVPSPRTTSSLYRDLVLSTTYDILGTESSFCSNKNFPSRSVTNIDNLDQSRISPISSDFIKGVTVPDEFTGEEVFATQLNEDDYPGLGQTNKHRKGHRTGRSSRKSDKGSTTTDNDDEESRGDASSVASGSVDGKKSKKNKKKDFIKRNKELAGDAANLIAMTDEEKKRLDDLLKDVEEIPEIPEGAELDENNPFQLAVKPGEGFFPENDDLRSLTSIDSRLKELMLPEDYQSIASSSMSHVPQNKLFTHTGVKHAVDWESRGERALFQNAEQREMNERMLAIEQELACLKNREETELETPRLEEDQLKDLIDQCVTSLSHASMSRMTLNSESRTSFAESESTYSHSIDGAVDNTPRSPRSARQEILDNPPKLAPEVLQKLLSEAYHPLSKQLSTLKEEDSEEEESTPIPSEVWKLISMETVDESQSIDTTVKSSMDSQITTNVSESYNESNNVLGVNGKNNVNSRNGFRTLSRNSSGSSLASVSELGTGRETREKEPLKLPDIDPSGSLVTQGLNNHRRNGSSNSSVRTPVNFVQNSFSDSKSDNLGPSDSRLELLSLDGEIMSPHPPSREKRDGSGNKSRSGSRTLIS